MRLTVGSWKVDALRGYKLEWLYKSHQSIFQHAIPVLRPREAKKRVQVEAQYREKEPRALAHDVRARKEGLGEL